MITLKDDTLSITFPEIAGQVRSIVERQIQKVADGQTYSPPSAWGQLPLRSVDDFAETAPAAWMRKGGVIMPLGPQ